MEPWTISCKKKKYIYIPALDALLINPLDFKSEAVGLLGVGFELPM